MTLGELDSDGGGGKRGGGDGAEMMKGGRIAGLVLSQFPNAQG